MWFVSILVFSAVICWVIYELPCFLFNKPCAITEYRWSSFHQKQSWRCCWGGRLCKEVTGVCCPWRDALAGLWNSCCGCAAVERPFSLIWGIPLLHFWLCSFVAPLLLSILSFVSSSELVQLLLSSYWVCELCGTLSEWVMASLRHGSADAGEAWDQQVVCYVQ